MRISKRTECEICLSPFETHTVYEYRCTGHPGGFRCGDASDNTTFAVVIILMSIVYFTLLLFFPNWSTVFFISVAYRLISLIWLLPMRGEIYVENIALHWQLANTLTVLAARACTYSFPMTSKMHRTQISIMYVEMILFVTFFVLRLFFGCCRGTLYVEFTRFPDTSDTTNDL